MFLNGHRTSRAEYNPAEDGILESGRPLNVVGAHCKGHNSRSVGLCLIGTDSFTNAQMDAAYQKVQELLRHFNLDPDAVYGHYELDDHKTCPNIDMDIFREKLWELRS